MQRSLSATSPQTMGDSTYTYDHWSQGGGAAQNFLVTDSNQSFKAFYNASGGTSTACSATGTITRDFWSNFTGASVSDVPVNTTPTSTSNLTIFEGPSNVADKYGSRIRGYICPPVTGNYTFWIASDNGSELWLSTSSNPSAKVKIASVSSYTLPREWTKYPAQKSAAIALTAGTKYYIEAIHREGDQGDHLAVGWQLPNGSMERPIPGSRLSPFTSSGGGTTPVVAITAPANNTTYSSPANITFDATASSSGGTITKVEFYNGSSLIGQDLTFPYTYTWMNVSTGTYTIKAKATNNTGQTALSSPITVIVQGCATPIITALGSTTMCSGSVTLKTTAVSGASYQWKRDGVSISGANASSYTASSTGENQVKVISGSCISWSAPTKVSIQSGLRATITPGGPLEFCPGGNVKLFGNTCSGYTFQWIKDGANIPGANAANYIASAAGTYQLRVTQAGTNAWSSLVTVQINCREGEEEEGAINPDPDISTIQEEESDRPFLMKVYPNPTNGLFTIAFNMPADANEKIKIRIVNLLGQEIYNKELTVIDQYIKETVELDPSLPTGIYTLQVLIGTKMENTNVVLAR
ncbi:MAG: T9SS type A sorting domain-containing protein [Bacteroidetes bacterium]|nr:T9SS type A sorting domain-containing protein [Bacteroidota bacterium]